MLHSRPPRYILVRVGHRRAKKKSHGQHPTILRFCTFSNLYVMFGPVPNAIFLKNLILSFFCKGSKDQGSDGRLWKRFRLQDKVPSAPTLEPVKQKPQSIGGDITRWEKARNEKNERRSWVLERWTFREAILAFYFCWRELFSLYRIIIMIWQSAASCPFSTKNVW